MRSFDHYFHAPFASARAYLFSRVFLALVALDTFLLMIGHAGRYGVDGFNVAHFGWLDAIAPLPSAGLYIGVLLVAGLLAGVLALTSAAPVALFALFLLYTFSWAMSMLDSYQHHYFISSVLLCLVFFPVLRARDVHPPPPAAASTPASQPPKSKAKAKKALRAQQAASKRPPPPSEPRTARGFGYNLLGATAGLLYTFTAIAKLDAAWREGHTILRISAAREVFAPLAQWASSLGIEEEQFWSLVATSVIPVELSIALTYFVAVRADDSRSKLPRILALAGFVLAIGLHLGAEAMQLEIGWFSYYMILFACAYLLPARAIDRLARVLTTPANLLEAQLADLLAPEERTRTAGPTIAIALAVALTLGAVGWLLDLPGALAACIVAALLTTTVAITACLRGRALEVRPLLLSTGVAAAFMWLSIAQSESRWDFYRFLGGDLRRRGEPAAALEAYERGERYAPEGQSRQSQIDELRRELGR